MRRNGLADMETHVRGSGRGAPELVTGLVLFGWSLVGLLHESAGFVDCALGVVVCLNGEAILVDGAIALAGEIEDAA